MPMTTIIQIVTYANEIIYFFFSRWSNLSSNARIAYNVAKNKNNKMYNCFPVIAFTEIVVKNTNKIADMCEIVEVIIDTGGIPFSPRVKSDDGKEYLDCPVVVTDLVYTKAKDWYGEPLPYSIEERIATELYGDIVFKIIKEN